MSAGVLNPSVRFQPRSDVRDESENGSTSFLDEGAILLENQVQSPDDEGQNMAASSAAPNKMTDGSSVVDMVLVYEVPDPSSLDSEKEQQEEEDKNKIREFYIDGLKAAGLLVEVDQIAMKTSDEAEVNTCLYSYILWIFVVFIVKSNAYIMSSLWKSLDLILLLFRDIQIVQMFSAL